MSSVFDIQHERCAGGDVHKKTVVACRRYPDGRGNFTVETRSFRTMTKDLLALLDWLMEVGCTHFAMESTGDYWKPVYNILEGNLELLVVNAKHIKNVPGRKTDRVDAQWIAKLLQVGLLRGSFVPPVGQRELRDLTRHRTNFVRERTNMVNRLQKVLETANIKLASVATDVMGVSGRAMLQAIIEGTSDATTMADLAKGRMRTKKDDLADALDGRVKDHHRFILAELLTQIDGINETIDRFNTEIEKLMAPFKEGAALLATITGVGEVASQVIVSELGTDMSVFATDAHAAAWAGVAPGNHESAGKRGSGRVRQGNQTLRRTLIQCTHAAVKTKGTYLAAQYHRLAGRRGKKRAIMAVAHSILVSAYHMLKNKVTYQDLGGNYFDKLNRKGTTARLLQRLQDMGLTVTVQEQVSALAA